MVSIAELLREEMKSGDSLLIEYPGGYPIEDLLWGQVMPAILQKGMVLVDDFFGVGDLMFRNYVRKLPASEYKTLLRGIRNISVIKIGPGQASYGKILVQVPLTYDSEAFLDSYYGAIRESLRTQDKPLYFVSLGVSEYIYFGKEKALQTLLVTRSSLPIEDWASVYLLNTDLVNGSALALMEELSSWVLEVWGKEGSTINLKKGLIGGSNDKRRGQSSAD
ncbi:DUF257 family protein [Palaeococcus ferrophilus]|uniref:DUF257 family protein n=1 Tax=Palaeococcus ferrophilus TaxID=83868 RepID=UPI00064E261E|nr:DUF257 family protein [Palaeococcus ferrophilus]